MSRIIKSVAVGKKPVVIDVPEVKLPVDIDLLKNIPDSECDVAAENALAAADIINAAKSEAAEILENAQGQVAILQAQAAQECEVLKNEAYDLGLKQGYEDGLAQARQIIEDAEENARVIVVSANKEGRKALLSSEQQMIDISLAVARKILNREISENPYTVLPLIKTALERVRDQDKVTIRVSPENLEVVQFAKAELQSVIVTNSALNIVADDSLKDADCIVETPFGAVDARIDTQFENIKSVLRDVENDLV